MIVRTFVCTETIAFLAYRKLCFRVYTNVITLIRKLITFSIWRQLCHYENLALAFKKARKHKTLKLYVIEFEKNLKENLLQLQSELVFHTYSPKPLETFILRDPKTRKISKSDFRDRVIHHALCNIIEPIFEKNFIYDSYANRKSKGGLKALKRFEKFSRKVSKNHTKTAFVLKADVKHYFESVNHAFLLQIIQNKIKDARIIWLIEKILKNHSPENGMPLGNLTSQFFANVYLNELDWFVKHKLKAKYYLRYVDDFIILHSSREVLEAWRSKIDSFLYHSLALELHPDKSKILFLHRGIDFLGFKIFPKHRLMKRRNRRKFQRKLQEIYSLYDKKKLDYNQAYDFMEGWMAYAKHANTYKLRRKFLAVFEEKFSQEITKNSSSPRQERHCKYRN